MAAGGDWRRVDVAKAGRRPQRIQRRSIFQENDQVSSLLFDEDEHENPLYLRPLQWEALIAIKNADRRPVEDPLLIVMPTGSGKSGVVVAAPYVIPRPPRKVLVLTPSNVISSQLHNDFGNGADADPSFFERIGFYNTGDRDQYKPSTTVIRSTQQFQDQQRAGFLDLTVVNAQKFSTRTRFIDANDRVLIPADSFDLVIVDEAHHYPAETWRRLVDHFANVRKIFLTATPDIATGPILPGVAPLVRFTIDDAVDRGIIRKPKIVELSHPAGQTEVDMICLRIHDEILRRTRITGYQHQAMILVESSRQAVEAVAAAYNRQFPDPPGGCRGFHSESPLQIPRDFARGDCQVLVVCGCLLEGYDNPKVSVLGIIRNIARTSVVLFTQFIGRGLRKPSLPPSDIEVPLLPALILSSNSRNIAQYFQERIQQPVLPQEADVEEEKEDEEQDVDDDF